MSVSTTEIRPPFPGEPAPWFHAASAANPRFAFSSVAGRYVLLAFVGPAGERPAAAAAEAMQPLCAEGLLDDANRCAFLLTLGPPAPQGPKDLLPGLRVLADAGGDTYRAYGLLRPDPEGKAAAIGLGAFLLDPLLRVIAACPLERVGELVALLRRLPPPHLHAGQETPAPVLLLPRVFEPELCRHLIGHYAKAGGQDSGYMIEREGKTVGVYDYGHKRRFDCVVGDADLQATIRARVSRRLVPEIRKAFQFEVTRIERYVIACYDAATGGHFAAHRDNTTPGTAHRRFAVTINLNDDFEGGELWFPEFGPRRYRPPAGGAVVFSCSLLHEATPVTKGTRYAVLPFLYDDAAARIREANQASVTPQPPAGAAGQGPGESPPGA
ncbi:2OG-Fe(II) oxygenase [Dankookia rubra]|uniref:2OG-Fe(II) oxygenase n=1 Tax=Dankookia rubra TaxID=1442381 RepID=A0A4R5QBP6_9PROT|nr:2OG-Fe(II) oxygenase [Dankookia rubra]TDH59697.1 2OG-Fe(II) oxygenase [Dankookia rubra]